MHIRAERSEQEVTAAAFVQEASFPYLLGTAGRAGPWHTGMSHVFVVHYYLYQPSGCHSWLAQLCPSNQPPKRVAPDAIRGCRRQLETVSETVPPGDTSPTCPAVRTAPRHPPAALRTSFTPSWKPMKFLKWIFLPRKTRTDTKA